MVLNDGFKYQPPTVYQMTIFNLCMGWFIAFIRNYRYNSVKIYARKRITVRE